jgi:hypothetical protein
MYAVNQGGKEDTWCDEFFGYDRACMVGVVVALHAIWYGGVRRKYLGLTAHKIWISQVLCYETKIALQHYQFVRLLSS